MDLTTFLIILLLFIIMIVISLFIDNTRDRIAFYCIMGLACLCVINTYSIVVYYIKLRNDPGVQGPPGNKGSKGPKGDPGKCSFSDKCGIEKPREKILDIASEMYDIPKQCLDKPTKKACKDSDTFEQANIINKQIGVLESIAYKTSMTENDFIKKLKVCLNDPDGCSEDLEEAS
jgi:hypothetical protein